MNRLSYRARRRLSLAALLIWLPLYVVLAVNIVEMFDRPGVLWELLIFVVLGFLWMLPLKFVFLGVGKADPDAPHDSSDKD